MEVNLKSQSISVSLNEMHGVGDIRRQAMSLASGLNFTEVECGNVGIIATELAGNLVKHANGGEIVLRTLIAGNENGLEIISLDKGPGMNLERCLEDGYSTAGSPGTGLGAITRLSNLEIYSQSEKGSILVASIWSSKAKNKLVNAGAISIPLKGEKLCGDSWFIKNTGNKIRMIVADGLGHGNAAAEASTLAIEIFDKTDDLPPVEVINELHKALLNTRGAAVAVVEIDLLQDQLVFAGVGNIAGYMLNGQETKGMASYNGTVGHQIHKVKEFTYPCTKDALIILHSDGLSTKWKIEDYPGLHLRQPSLIAAALYRDFKREKDDATIVVLRR